MVWIYERHVGAQSAALTRARCALALSCSSPSPSATVYLWVLYQPTGVAEGEGSFTACYEGKSSALIHNLSATKRFPLPHGAVVYSNNSDPQTPSGRGQNCKRGSNCKRGG